MCWNTNTKLKIKKIIEEKKENSNFDTLFRICLQTESHLVYILSNSSIKCNVN